MWKLPWPKWQPNSRQQTASSSQDIRRGNDLTADVAGVADDGPDPLLSLGGAGGFPASMLAPDFTNSGRSVSFPSPATCPPAHSPYAIPSPRSRLIVELSEVSAAGNNIVVGYDNHQAFAGRNNVAQVDQRLEQTLAADFGTRHRQEDVPRLRKTRRLPRQQSCVGVAGVAPLIGSRSASGAAARQPDSTAPRERPSISSCPNTSP